MRHSLSLAAFCLILACAGGERPPLVMTGGSCAHTIIPPAPAPLAGEDVAGLFPRSYETGRARFIAECSLARQSPSDFCQAIPVSDPADIDLTIDVAYFTRGHPNLIVLQSGLHGAEGFAGSAVQTQLFARQLPELLSSGFDVLLLHAVNPYGFKNVRRVESCNIDLNRNFPVSGNLYQTVNVAFDRVRGLTERQGPVENVVFAKAAIKVETVSAALFHGFKTVAEGTHRGQYVEPAAFEFGGQRPAQQVAILRALLTPLIEGHRGDVFFLDLHTGLGPANSLTLYSGIGWQEDRRKWLADLAGDAAERWRRQSGGEASLGTIGSAEPCESEFTTSGDVIDYVPGLADDNRVTAITVEWGTIGNSTAAQLETNARQTLEHQAHFNGCISAQVCATVRKEFADLFNPPNAMFQRAVLGQADALLAALQAFPSGRFRSSGRPDPTAACQKR